MVENGTVSMEAEVRPIWRMSMEEEPAADRKRPCLMQNAPLKLFICPQIAECPLPCSQKEEQEKDQDFVFRQRLKLKMLVDRTMQTAGDAKRD
jgi:hypothetical protein